jgi:hypothetical protein
MFTKKSVREITISLSEVGIAAIVQAGLSSALC